MKNKSEKIQCPHFVWRIFQRDEVFYACGRSHAHGKHSLGTRDREKAIKALIKLDAITATNNEVIGGIRPARERVEKVSISDGWKGYIDGHSGPRHLGGLAESSERKYQIHKQHFERFCSNQAVICWSKVSKLTLQEYGTYLEQSQSLSPRTVHNDITMQIAVSNWLICENMIPSWCKINWKLKKPPASNQYCYTVEQVRRILKFTEGRDDLRWIHDIVMLLSHSGMRITEAINLRWSDVKPESGIIYIRDERYERIPKSSRRMIKDGESRNIPIPLKLEKFLQRKNTKKDWVLRGPKGRQLNYNVAREQFVEKVIEPLSSEFPTTTGEVGFKDARFHSFRHFFVSECFAAGLPESDIRDSVGHSNSKIVELYRHRRNDVAKHNISRVDFGSK